MTREEILEDIHYLNINIPRAERKEDVALVEEMMEEQYQLEMMLEEI